VDERERLEELRFLRRLQRENPSEYHEVMRARLGLPARDPIRQLAEQLRALRAVGFDLPVRDDTSPWLGLLRETLQALALGLGQTLGSQVRLPVAPQPVPLPPHPPVSPPAHTNGAVTPDRLVHSVIEQLQKAGPPEAARFLQQLGAAHPGLGEALRVLCQLPEEMVLPWLGQLGDLNPPLKPLVEFLKARESWTLETVRLLRKTAVTEGV
jgi:hypothetical protein